MSAPLLSVEDLTVGYRTRRGLAPVVHGVSLQVERGEVLALVGESGSGKTTTGHAVLGLLPANGQVLGGAIRFRGQDLTGLGARAWRDLRGRAISLVPQDPTVSLDPVRRVGHQVDDVLRLHTDLDARARRERVHELFDLVGLTDVERHYAQYPGELSGGMRQRVLIATAVAVEPDLVVADEPTSGLDATVQKQVLDLLDDLRTRTGTAVLLVTHDLGVASDRSDRIAVMQGGHVAEHGSTAEVLADPQHPYTQRLLDSVPARAAFARDRIALSGGEGDSAPLRPARERSSHVEHAPLVRDPGARERSSHGAPPHPGARERSSQGVAVQVTGLRKEFGDVAAVDGISFTVRHGETFSVVGESGSGKSTTARILTGLTRATSGTVSILGTDVTQLGRRGFRPLRRDVQIVHQNPYASFDPRFDVHQVVEEPLRSLRPGPRPRGRHPYRDQVVAALEAAALPADVVDRHPRELSGGQRQRVAIARALVIEPQVVVLDEPISALDVSVAAQILELLQRLQAERGLTYVFISHDLAVVRAISDRVAVMRHGRIVEQGPVEQVFAQPATDYTVRLIDAIAGRDLTVGVP